MSDLKNDKLSCGLQTYNFSYVGRVTACVDVVAKSQEDALKKAKEEILKYEWTGGDTSYDDDAFYDDDGDEVTEWKI